MGPSQPLQLHWWPIHLQIYLITPWVQVEHLLGQALCWVQGIQLVIDAPSRRGSQPSLQLLSVPATQSVILGPAALASPGAESRALLQTYWIQIYILFDLQVMLYILSKSEEPCFGSLQMSVLLSPIALSTCLSSAWDTLCPSLCLTPRYPSVSAWISCLLGRLPSLTS